MTLTYGPRGGDDISHTSRSLAAHELSQSIQNDKAVQVVAAQASDVDDCIELLAMLGLDAQSRSWPGLVPAASDFGDGSVIA